MSRAAMQQALAYIEEVDYGPYDKQPVVTALKQALSEPEQEPVAWRYRGNLHEFDPSDWAEGPVTPLYTAPTPRKPLTDEEISAIDWKSNETLHDFARAIERAHGIGEQHGS